MNLDEYYTDLEKEFNEVIETATWAISQAMEDGFNHGYHGNWKGQSHVVHVSHAFQHLEEALKHGLNKDAINDIEHALCRLAMALIQWSSD